ncbi:hypothetical protein HY065_02955 [Candidatus Berkelbacteria bacterium]|nr:hypothetical protein [Candidatus Berkelbacteria bacterium]
MAKENRNRSSLKAEIRRQTASYIIGAFGLIAGLAWNEAIKSMIEYFFPLNQNTLTAKLIYAVFITIVVAILSYFVLDSQNQPRKRDE